MDDSYVFCVGQMVLMYDAECRGLRNTDVCLDCIVTYPLSDTH